MSLLDELGQALAAVADDPQARSAVAAEFLLRSRPPDEQTALAAAFDAAAVLRWFDAELLARVLQIPPATAAERLRQLRALPFIEPYRSGAHELVNVHESTRLGWRSKLARETPERFRALSAAAAACFADDQTPAGRIEWIYHLLSADGESGADALETIDQEWTGRAHPAQRYALATALSELEANGLLAGRARLWVLLVIGWTRIERGEAAQLAALADEALRLAVAANDARGQAGACNLHGHACQTRGQLDAALRAFTECLQTSRRLADLDPANADWQRDLGVAHNYVGSVLQAQGQLDAALRAFTEDLAISRRLADLDPGNADWQRGLAFAHNRVGGVLQTQGQLDAALRAFTEALAISRRLADLDPGNANWQRGLAAAHNRVGGVLQAQGQLDAALHAFTEALAISRRLVDLDPGNAQWQRDLAVAHNHVGGVLLAQGQLDAALHAFTEALAISRRLVDLDPGNADWQRGLAVAHHHVGRVLQAQGQLDAALLALTEGLAIFRRLAELDPGNAAWQRGLAVGCVCIAGLEAARGKPQAAVALCEEASQILAALTATLPETHPWRFEKGAVDLLLAHYRALVADDNSGWRALRALG